MADTIPVGLCQCGCGQPTSLAGKTNRRLGHVQGQPVSFIAGHHVRLFQRAPVETWPEQLCACGCGQPTDVAPKTSSRSGHTKGRPMTFLPCHHNKARGMSPHHYPAIGQQKIHLVMAQRALGKPLPRGCQVHHVDENPNNHTPGNLVICQDQAYHQLLHRRAKVVRAGRRTAVGA